MSSDNTQAGQSYGFTFDLFLTLMKQHGFNPPSVYQVDIPKALASCGFARHPEGSVYISHKPLDEPDEVIASLRVALNEFAPPFGQFVKRAHLFFCEDWSDVTRALRTERVSPRDLPASEAHFTPLDAATEHEFDTILNEVRRSNSQVDDDS